MMPLEAPATDHRSIELELQRIMGSNVLMALRHQRPSGLAPCDWTDRKPPIVCLMAYQERPVVEGYITPPSNGWVLHLAQWPGQTPAELYATLLHEAVHASMPDFDWRHKARFKGALIAAAYECYGVRLGCTISSSVTTIDVSLETAIAHLWHPSLGHRLVRQLARTGLWLWHGSIAAFRLIFGGGR